MLQVWTRFAKFDEIHSNPSPKNSEKNQAASGCIERSPHQVPAPGKNFFIPNHFIEHLLDTGAIKFSQVQLTVSETTVVFFSVRSQSRQCPGVALLPVPSPLSLHRTSAWMFAGIGDVLEEVRRPVTDASGGFAAARERRGANGATQRRPSHRRSPRGHPLPSARCHPRRELLGAERALCRRRARTAAPSRTSAITPSPTQFSSGTAPVNLPDAAWPLKPPAQPLPRRNHTPEISRSRPSPRISYK